MLSALRRSVESKPSFQEIQENVLAGLTVGVIALPLSMALAIASGVAPQHGLYTAIIAGVVIALTGGLEGQYFWAYRCICCCFTPNCSSIWNWRFVIERFHGWVYPRFNGYWQTRETN